MLVVAVPRSASVRVIDPAVTPANVGLDDVAMLCGRDSVTAPVEAVAEI